MVKARTWFSLFIISLGTVVATASCGSDEATGGGTGGAGGGSILGGGGRSGATSVGRAGSSTGGGGSTPTGVLGSMCAASSDCDTGLTCITPDSTVFGSGGPSLGMCTMACAGDADCSALETGAGCVNFGTQAAPNPFCLEGCTQGGDSTAFDTKCQGRADFSCSDLSSTTTPDPFCLPRCRADIECGTGLFCNKRNGLCSKTKVTGDPVGSPCDPAATTNTCAGTCIHFSASNKGVCAELCSGYLPCMFAGSVPGGLCSGALSTNFGPVDEGFCEPSCGCSSDCPFPGDLCREWPAAQADFKMVLGAEGMCYPSVQSSVELSCGEGGAGGASSGTGSAGASGASGASN